MVIFLTPGNPVTICFGQNIQIQKKARQVSAGLQVQENAIKGYRWFHHLPDLEMQYA